MSSPYNDLSGRSVERLRTLTDGVFAVAMTLLVLDLRLPVGEVTSNRELWDAVRELGPQLAAYLLSFTMLGTFWLAEHTLLDRCRTSGRMLSWACLAFLFFTTTLPFSASVLAEHPGLAFGVGLYWLNLLGLGLTLGVQLWCIVRRGYADDPEAVRLIVRRLVVAQVRYAVGAAVALVSPVGAFVALALVQLLFIVSPRLPIRV